MAALRRRVFILSRIMLPGGIYVLMSQHIGYQVDIARFLIQSGSVSTAELVRRNFLQGCHLTGIFLHHISTALTLIRRVLGGVERERARGLPEELHVSGCLRCSP